MFERQAISVRKLFLGIIAVTAVLSSVDAQESGLYGSVGDDSRAFVRVINATSEERIEGVRVGPTRFPEITAVSPYQLLRPGVYIVSANGVTSDFIARAG